MTVNEIATALSLKLLAGGTDKPFDGVYVGDLLSRCMSRVGADSLWITIMANVNAIAVATLTEPAAIILAEDVDLPEEALSAARDNDITILSSPLTAYELCREISRLADGEGK